MVNYAVTNYSTDRGTIVTVLAALETKLETIDNAKTIRLIGILPTSQGKECVGYLIYDA